MASASGAPVAPSPPDAPDAHAFAIGTAATPAADDDAASIKSRHTLKTLGGAQRSDSSISIRLHHSPDDDDQDDPWHAQQGRPGAPPPAAPVLDPLERRRLLLRAGGQLLILFVVCLVGLGGTLWLALPVIDDADRPAFKIPRSLEQLKDLNRVLQHYKSENFAQVMLCWFIVYIFLQAFSIPGSMYMSILAGALWGVPIALPLVCASVATGATICYLISKFLGVVLVALPSWKARIDTWKDKLAQHNDNMLSYLIVIRMMPLPPHNVVNLLAPHLGIDIGLFWLSTFCGIFAVSVIHTTLGEKLDEMTSADDFNLLSLRNVLLLGGVCVAVLIPVVVRKLNGSEALEEPEDATTHGPVRLDDDVEDRDELPPSFLGRNRSLIGRSRSDARYSDDDGGDNSDDELPPMTGLRIDGVDEQDDTVSAWRDPALGSRIGEDGFREDDASPMFADRNSTARTAPAAGSVGERMRSWWSKGQ
ncbi:uncharacterized protein PFL1_05190 [Pseudozyma flocculosa PF-1]|uniref:VTT domain-containing protein n=2 Tax=Pseudozyma flocculosa TaxID=84751 RepID=A0A5C3F8B9_9BASI|nr:uncharacterized protein PFL1_05190 [Pseudozyma flocculosa PF-1]EPQ27267.1 hypothetical protein PFL1_05190 [Pseudozyma flocculosa PF-1]SPO39639.1 uncharacterized protein PSFLO_05120 [Pseudozyma flocculosa]